MKTEKPELVVGTWPGVGQEYISRFCESLEMAQIEVKRIEDPWRALFLRLDVFHIHWPEKILWDGKLPIKIFRAFATVVSLLILKVRGVLLVWCVHNDQPHDASRHLLFFWRFYIWIISGLVDGFLTLSPSTVEVVRQRVPKLASKPGTFVWHPTYRLPVGPHEIVATRRRIGVQESDLLLCSFGFQKRYKGVDDLIACFLDVKIQKCFLGICGVADEGASVWLNEVARRDPRIHPQSKMAARDGII